MKQHFDSSRKNKVFQESIPKFRTTIKDKLLLMTNEINYFRIGNIKARNSFSLKQITQIQLFCTQNEVTWWQDLNGLLQVLSRYLKVIWKCFFFFFPAPLVILFYDNIHILHCIRMLYYDNNVTFQYLRQSV